MKNGDTNTRHDGEEPQAPRKLASALKEPPARRVFVPPAMDASILSAARKHLSKPEGKRFGPFRSWMVWPAVATTCVMLAGWGYFAIRQHEERLDIARGDINRDGRVDILDALQVAREANQGTKSNPKHDLNGDGVLDLGDAEVIAAKVVKLDKGGKS